jgi:hypothetical protein
MGSAQLDPHGARRNLLVGSSRCACNTCVKLELRNNRVQLTALAYLTLTTAVAARSTKENHPADSVEKTERQRGVLLKILAPRAGLEPATLRQRCKLTGRCSALAPKTGAPSTGLSAYRGQAYAAKVVGEAWGRRATIASVVRRCSSGGLEFSGRREARLRQRKHRRREPGRLQHRRE